MFERSTFCAWIGLYVTYSGLYSVVNQFRKVCFAYSAKLMLIIIIKLSHVMLRCVCCNIRLFVFTAPSVFLLYFSIRRWHKLYIIIINAIRAKKQIEAVGELLLELDLLYI